MASWRPMQRSFRRLGAVLALALAFPVAAASVDDDLVGFAEGPVSVPSETLPPNQAARELEKAERRDFILSQRGAALFAYAAVPVLDRKGQPVADAKTKRPQEDRFCIVWRPAWARDNKDVSIKGSEKWATSLSFLADPENRRLKIYELGGPALELVDGELRRLGGSMIRSASIVVPLLDLPRDDWPCSQETWVAQLQASPREYYDIPVLVLTPRRRSGPPERSPYNPCYYVNGSRVPYCHQ